jgi:hypothetical protein
VIFTAQTYLTIHHKNHWIFITYEVITNEMQINRMTGIEMVFYKLTIGITTIANGIIDTTKPIEIVSYVSTFSASIYTCILSIFTIYGVSIVLCFILVYSLYCVPRILD